jgi:hydroxylamine reductase
MFCYQCEQTAGGKGCQKVGVCGKDPNVAALQDLLTWILQGLAIVAVDGRKHGISDHKVNMFTCKALFSTLTNVNFDSDRIAELIHAAVQLREELKKKVAAAGGSKEFDHESANFTPAKTLDDLVKQGQEHDLFNIKAGEDEDIHSLKSIIILGLRGIAAYTDHAGILGQEDDKIFAFIHEALVESIMDRETDVDLVKMVLKCGEINFRAMELLDAGHTTTYGHPVPTPVSLGAVKGKAILISGHDMKDLEELLKQTEGKGINIYTHGEMLPAHGYPGLKKYKHLAGHYGTAWQNQKKEFELFPGAILMTTNCIQAPKDSYMANIFTRGLVGFHGVKHIPGRDFSSVINKALEMPGFTEDKTGVTVLTGFARNAVLGVAPQVIDAVKAGKIRHFFLVGGCDGAKPGRDYYTEFVEKTPKDTVILTLACGKFRFFDKQLGDIDGIPRLLDVGQCNDAYSAIQIALALAGAFNCGVNDLPLSMILSWYEQKAVSILLTLLHLGIKDIRLGPSLPAFITPNVLDVLVKNFNIMPITTPDADLKTILG